MLFGALQTVPDVALLPHHAAARSVVVPLSRAAAVCVIPPCHVSRFILADSRNRFQFELPLLRAAAVPRAGAAVAAVRAEARAAVARVEEATALGGGGDGGGGEGGGGERLRLTGSGDRRGRQQQL